VRGIAHLVYGGVFERFPTLKFVQTENGCSWLPSYMRTLDQLVAGSHKPGSVGNLFGAAAFERLSLKPSEYMKRNCWVGTFLTGPDMASRSEFNADHVMWGADFPHHEGTSPMTTKALRINFADVGADETRRILSENASACYGFDLDQLQTIADQIGPSPATVHTPLAASDYPRYPEDTVCPTFVAADNFEGFAPGVRD
jgi:predicted TIM-barrel fold metal-dependent hydrolase